MRENQKVGEVNEKKYLMTLLILIMTMITHAEVTKIDAEDMVLNQIIQEDVGKVNVFIKNNPLTNNKDINLYKGYQITVSFNSSWIFFIDDYPSARWFHPCRYIAIDIQSGEYEIIEESIYPANEEMDFELISSPSYPEFISPQINPSENEPVHRTENGNLYAIIIGGDMIDDPTSSWDDDECFWNDTSGIYCTLLEYGYSRENIRVHYAEGYGPNGIDDQDLDNPDEYTDDIDFEAEKQLIFDTFEDIQTLLTPKDMLFIYLNDHGYYDGDDVYLCLPGRDVTSNRLYDHELEILTRNINCSQIIFRIDCCYSGGFIDNLDDPEALCQNRIVHTPCGFEPGWAEKWITSPSAALASKYMEFNLYWTAAARGWYPYIDFENHQNIEAWHEYIETGNFPFTQYSSWDNQMPGYPTHDDFPDYDPDDDPDNGNDDGFAQMWEIFKYANNWDSFSNDEDQTYNEREGYYNPFQDFHERPTPEETPQQFPEEQCFLNMFLTLAGISGTIEIADLGLNPTISGNYLFTDTLRIKQGNIVTIASGSQITLSNYTNIILEDGAELVFENDANIVFGDSITFSTPVGQIKGKLRINGSDPVVCNDLQFSNCDFYTNNTKIEIHEGNFTNSYFEHLNETLILDDIVFDESYILAERRLVFSPPFYVNIQDCSIQNSDTYAVKISSYPEFTVSNNNISNNVGAALLLYNNTDGIIESNNLNNNSVGINLTNTEAEIIGYNEICDNSNYGIIAFTYANWSLVGVNDSPCQIIANNNGDNAEVFFFNTSLPDEVTFNKIYDANFNSEFVRCYELPSVIIDVENNFWGGAIGGNSRIPTPDNLTPFLSYDYTPVWNPGIPKGGVDESAKLLYNSGKELEADEYYVAAEQTYKDVISLYPASSYSKMAAKQLMTITEKTDQDYFTLKNYYDTEPNMTYDDEMIKVSSFLSNQCNIKITEFSIAIDWFEDVISDPPSQIDSVLAVIDLGHTYLLMDENGNRGNYVGKFPNLKPDSWEDYEENTIQLINSLFGEPELDQEEELLTDMIPEIVELYDNYPNPFNPTTTISYSLPEESVVELTIFNIKGQKVTTLVNSNMDKGNHSIIWSGNDTSNKPVSSGVYFYKLKVNSKTEETKKMLLLK